jgi:hypothetical protein
VHKATQETGRAARVDLVELAAKVLPVVAVLLPVAGIVTRFVAFSFDRVPLVAILAVDPGLLIATAVIDLVDVLVVLFVALVVARALASDDGPLSGPVAWLARTRAATRVALALATVIGGVALLVFAVRYSTIPVTLGALLLVVYWQRRARQWGGLPFSRIWASTALFFVFAAAMGGLSGVTLPAGFYVFAEGTTDADGFYVEIGRAANLVYLRSCGQASAPLHHAVNQDHVDRVLLSWENDPRAPGARTIWDLIVGEDLDLGVRYICPADPEAPPA